MAVLVAGSTATAHAPSHDVSQQQTEKPNDIMGCKYRARYFPSIITPRDEFLMSHSGPALTLVVLTLFSGSALAQQSVTATSAERLASARTVAVSVEVNYNRADSAKYRDNAEVNKLFFIY
jgi:hypothetical protein